MIKRKIKYIRMYLKSYNYFEDVWYHGGAEKKNPFLMLLAAPTE